ncbi:MAG TPA: hypothetical protein GX743_11095 [Actinomycetales bacterium]|nr:hypothetical protein [Actinomycetales bacterium]
MAQPQAEFYSDNGPFHVTAGLGDVISRIPAGHTFREFGNFKNAHGRTMELQAREGSGEFVLVSGRSTHVGPPREPRRTL